MLKRGLVTDPTPRIAIRFDDGDADGYDEAKLFLERGISVSFSINVNTLDVTGTRSATKSARKLRPQDLVDLQKFARQHGAKVEVLSHSANNWARYKVGSTWNLESYGWAEILEELDRSKLEEYAETTVRGYVEPGDPEPALWIKQNRELIIEALKELGYDFAVGLERRLAPASYGALENMRGAPIGGYINSTTSPDDGLANLNTIQDAPFSLPFCTLHDPFRCPGAWTTDLGGRVISRGLKNGTSAPGRDPISGAPGWMLGADNNGAGIEGDPVTDASKELRFHLYNALGLGANIGLALHTQGRSNASNVALSTGTKLYPGHWSTLHLASLIERLVDSGHLIPATVSEVIEVMYADFAPGVDVANNPAFAIPQHDALDRYEGIPEIALARGLSMPGNVGYTALNDRSTTLRTATLDADAKFGPVALPTVIGKDITGDRGAAGGAILHGASDSNFGELRLGWPSLPPGLYEFSAAVSDWQAGQSLQVDDLFALGVRHTVDPVKYLKDPTDLNGYQSFQLCYPNVKQTDAAGFPLPASYDHAFLRLGFELPLDGTPVVSSRHNHTDVSVPAGGSLVLFGGPVTMRTYGRASLSSRVWLRANRPLPDGVTMDATIDALDEFDFGGGDVDQRATITATIYNNTASAFTFGGTTAISIHVEEDAQTKTERELVAIAPWIYRASFVLRAVALTPVTISRPRLILRRRY